MGSHRPDAAGRMDHRIEIADPFARRLLNRYLERRKADLAQLRAALADKNYASIELTGHNLSGSGAAYGLEQVSALGAALETAAQSAEAEEIGQLVDQLENFIDGVTVA